MVYLVLKTTKEGKVEFVSCWWEEERAVEERDRLRSLSSDKYWIKGMQVQD